MAKTNLESAYRLARQHAAPSFAMQGATVPEWRGVSYATATDGKGAAAYALNLARANLAACKAAAFQYETTAAIRDAARIESNDAKAAASHFARAGGPEYDAAAQRVTWAVAALQRADAAHNVARKALADARERVTFYAAPFTGPGCWQGGPTMAAGYNGGQFFALDTGDVVRNIRDAGDVVRLGHNGWYDNNDGESARDGSGLVVGVVGQLRARNGRAVFVPGWRLGDSCQGGAQFNLRGAIVAGGREESDAEEAAETAARDADTMAEMVAESERTYRAAWRAGQAWRDAGERLDALRASALAILAERRDARATLAAASWPTLCDAIRARVDSILAERGAVMAERAALIAGDDFWNGFHADAMARAAFCDGAEIDAMPGCSA